MDAISTGEVMLRLFLSLILGGAVGFEREREHMAAGLRTHMLVSLSSCLGMLAAYEAFGPTDGPSRIAQGILTGIGFLGAGTILHYAGHIRGLTTAASVWTVCLIGMSVGVGFYLGALVGTIAATLLLFLHENLIFRAR